MGKFGGATGGVLKKWHVGEQSAAVSLKRVKIEEKLLWTAYRNAPTLFHVTMTDPLRPPLPQNGGGGSQPTLKTAI